MTRVFGLEGTAWAASAAVFDSVTDDVVMVSDAYQPESGGIHPREAAEHMQAAIPRVIDDVLTTESDLDAVAFSQGPGLGPCLRICATAARAVAQRLDLPLIGVNHMVAHLEIGRHLSGFDSPVCLNASGANAHILAFHDGRYRVLGETMDTGVGNALDKIARHFDWPHPGGPKIEETAATGSYRDFPYVVKGMDFSFSGIVSAAKTAYDEGVPVEDVCRGVEETIFAMLCEVTERALSLTGHTDLVVGGGVGQNTRLRTMLDTMCEERDARFFAPPGRFLRDNAGMIAVLGAEMYDAGDTIPIDDSAVRPDYRPDDVPVSWRGAVPEPSSDPAGETEITGAEAVVTVGEHTVEKQRISKPYRHQRLDERLRRERTAMEARLLHEARKHGVPTPVIRDINPDTAVLVLERVGAGDLGSGLTGSRVEAVGRYLACLHGIGIVHGDPTTRNVRVNDLTYLIDFGLGFHTDDIEDYAMDLHVFEQSLHGTATAATELSRAFEQAYAAGGDEPVLQRLREIEQRGRYQD